MKNIFIVFFLSLIPYSTYSQTIHFVDPNAPGTNNGSSWGNAFISFQIALQEAQPGDEIWVAKGIFKPTSTQNRNATFQIPCGVQVYGGFNGSETDISQRDLIANTTILDGNIGEIGQSNDNIYHLVFAENCDSTTLIDGFTIINGYANGVGNDGKGGGILFANNNPAVETTPIVKNCDIWNNYAIRGGAFSSVGNLSALPAVRIENTRFYKNKSQLDGGALHSEGQFNQTRQVFIKNCIFSECRTALGSGGALSFENFGGNCMLDGCIFEKDSTKIGLVGGGINMILTEISSNFKIQGCQFNLCYSAGGGGLNIDDYGAQNAKTFKLNIENTSFDNNYSFNEGGAVLVTNGTKTISYLTLNQVLFEKNHSAGEGAGMHVYNRVVGEFYINILNSKFIENRGNVPGGGAFIPTGKWFAKV